MAFEFNKIYVIESLVKGERTGQELYNSVIRWFEDRRGIGSEFYSVGSKEELISLLEEISSNCVSNGFKPLIHFEIHGLKDKSGLALVDDSISWDNLSYFLRKINEASRWNLNLTMAVCYGNYFLKTLSPTKPSPVAGFVGSFEEITEGDFVPRFEDFYSTLRDTLSLDHAINAMMDQNRQFVKGFSYIDARRIFSEVYNMYLEHQFTDEVLWKRYLMACQKNAISPNPEMFQPFVELAYGKREEFFIEQKKIFFMINEFPENETRFPIFLKEVI
ncbi:hypothetical protein EF405_19070 [Cyclobacteriaceae bacterium YHN15]|nr:hypothetical protein EF405_19070 [Cyclobacteriaceae bacterium YHN15]